MTTQTLQIAADLGRDSHLKTIAMAKVPKASLLQDGVLHERDARILMSQAMSLCPDKQELNGFLVTYVDASATPRIAEYWSDYLPKGCAARGSVYLEDGTRLLRFQPEHLVEVPMLDMASLNATA